MHDDGEKTFSELHIFKTVTSPLLSQEAIELGSKPAKGSHRYRKKYPTQGSERNLQGDGERNL